MVATGGAGNVFTWMAVVMAKDGAAPRIACWGFNRYLLRINQNLPTQ
jgi:hypothetical protein